MLEIKTFQSLNCIDIEQTCQSLKVNMHSLYLPLTVW
jgi:hypothetical protein